MRKEKRIIFIGGVHGVGKGTLCSAISLINKIPHYSSSDILKWGEISSQNNKLVKDISSTQERLITGLKLVKGNNDYLLDGHLCLLNSYKIPKRIDENVFKLINPKIIVVVTENPEVIYKRLKERDSVHYSVSLLDKMQNMEVEYAKYLSEKFGIPFLELKNGKIYPLTEYLKK